MEDADALRIIQWSHLVELAGRIAAEALYLFKEMSSWEGRRGAYFCLADGLLGTPLLVVALGGVSGERAKRYLAFCQEKALRLAQHTDHLGSWQSRDLSFNQYGGAIRLGEHIFSFSGFPELGDEAVALAIAGSMHITDQGTLQFLDSVAAVSDNEYWEKLKRHIYPSEMV